MSQDILFACALGTGFLALCGMPVAMLLYPVYVWYRERKGN